MRVLIVGGTGLISTAITRQLVARGDEVVLYNRGQREADIPPVQRMVGDRNDYAAFEAQIGEAEPFDAVIDMVCFRPKQAESAIRAFRGRTAQYVFCSTVDVYTKPAPRYPVREDAPRAPSPACAPLPGARGRSARAITGLSICLREGALRAAPRGRAHAR
jgi:nucleoside-diphosphate-sugar epimerase